MPTLVSAPGDGELQPYQTIFIESINLLVFPDQVLEHRQGLPYLPWTHARKIRHSDYPDRIPHSNPLSRCIDGFVFHWRLTPLARGATVTVNRALSHRVHLQARTVRRYLTGCIKCVMAPVGSATMQTRPTSGTSCGGTTILPPSAGVRLAHSSTFSTAI